MMHKTLLIVLISSFLILCETLQGHPFIQSNDTLNQLKFHSALEKEGFINYLSGGKPDYIALAVAVNPKSAAPALTQVKAAIQTESSFLRTNIAGIKKSGKKLNYIFSHVQTTLLKEYDLDADFTDMFSSGKYNCLTATLLYSLLFEDLNIKYTVKFMPGHVYPIAYDGEVPYLFETTDPINGFVPLTDDRQREAIQNAMLLHYVKADNENNKKAAEIFDQYFIKLNNTGIKGLVGYQYLNATFFAFKEQEFFNAYCLIAKANVLTPMEGLKEMQEEFLKLSLLKTDNTSSLMASLLVEYYNTTSDKNRKNQLVDAFNQMVQTILFSHFPSPDSLMPVYTTIYNGIPDDDVREVIDNIYINNYIEYLMRENRKNEAIDTAYIWYTKGRNKEIAKGILIDYISYSASTYNDNKSELSSYDSIVKKYPALMEFELFRNNRCRVIISAAAEAFRYKNPIEAERLLTQFDTDGYFNEKTRYCCNPAWVYSLAGSYYFKTGNNVKAKAALKKGLTFDPENQEIKEKLKTL